MIVVMGSHVLCWCAPSSRSFQKLNYISLWAVCVRGTHRWGPSAGYLGMALLPGTQGVGARFEARAGTPFESVDGHDRLAGIVHGWRRDRRVEAPKCSPSKKNLDLSKVPGPPSRKHP